MKTNDIERKKCSSKIVEYDHMFKKIKIHVIEFVSICNRSPDIRMLKIWYIAVCGMIWNRFQVFWKFSLFWKTMLGRPSQGQAESSSSLEPYNSNIRASPQNELTMFAYEIMFCPKNIIVQKGTALRADSKLSIYSLTERLVEWFVETRNRRGK